MNEKTDMAADFEGLLQRIADLDRGRLDEAAEQHVHLYAEALEGLPASRDEFNRAERDIRDRKRELYGYYRDQTHPTTAKKYTEKEIDAAIAADESLQELKVARDDLYAELEHYEVLRGALRAREEALRVLSQLYLGGYWGVSGVQSPAGQRPASVKPTPRRRAK